MTDPTPSPEPDNVRPLRPPSTDLATQAPDIGRGSIAGVPLAARIRYAGELANAGDMLPRALFDRRTGQISTGKVLLLIETGSMLGIHPVAAINGVNVIEGKPAISPALMTALVRRAGHKVRVKVTGTVAAGDIVATVEVIRADDPTFTFSASWDLDRAVRASLCAIRTDKETGKISTFARSSKGDPLPWEKYPEAMLKARAIGEVCREAAEDALCGVHYTPEEMGMDVDVDGEVIEGTVVEDGQASDRPASPAPERDPAHREILVRDVDAIRNAILRAETDEALRDLYRRLTAAFGPAWVKVELSDEAGLPMEALAFMAQRAAALASVQPAAEPVPESGPAAPEPEPEPAAPESEPVASVPVEPAPVPVAEEQPMAPEAVAEALGGFVEAVADPSGGAWLGEQAAQRHASSAQRGRAQVDAELAAAKAKREATPPAAPAAPAGTEPWPDVRGQVVDAHEAECTFGGEHSGPCPTF